MLLSHNTVNMNIAEKNADFELPVSFFFFFFLRHCSVVFVAVEMLAQCPHLNPLCSTDAFSGHSLHFGVGSVFIYPSGACLSMFANTLVAQLLKLPYEHFG